MGYCEKCHNVFFQFYAGRQTNFPLICQECVKKDTEKEQEVFEPINSRFEILDL